MYHHHSPKRTPRTSVAVANAAGSAHLSETTRERLLATTSSRYHYHHHHHAAQNFAQSSSMDSSNSRPIPQQQPQSLIIQQQHPVQGTQHNRQRRYSSRETGVILHDHDDHHNVWGKYIIVCC